MDEATAYDLIARGGRLSDVREAWTDEAREKSAETRARNKRPEEAPRATSTPSATVSPTPDTHVTPTPLPFEGQPVNPNGKDTKQRFIMPNGKYTPERTAMHAKGLARIMKDVTPVENPEAWLMGGGTASGKTSIGKAGLLDQLPTNIAKVDADNIKEMTPEFVEMGKGSGATQAARFVHEESSDIAKMATRMVSERHCNLLLDGTGDGSIDNLQDKVAILRAGGQKVHAIYCTVETEDAIARSDARAESLLKAGKVPRWVPHAFIRNVHRDVSRTVPIAIRMGLFDDFVLYDNSGPKGTPPLKVASAVGTKLVIHDKAAWDRFVAKGTYVYDRLAEQRDTAADASH